jgi:hypothetical protein
MQFLRNGLLALTKNARDSRVEIDEPGKAKVWLSRRLFIQ